MVDQKTEPVAVSAHDGESASSPSTTAHGHDVNLEPPDSRVPRASVRVEVLKAVANQQKERILQLERQVEKKRAKVEQFTTQPQFVPPSPFCVMPPGHAGAASPANAQNVAHASPSDSNATPKTTANANSQPQPVNHPVMAAAMAAAAVAGSPHVSGAFPTHYPFMYAPPDHLAAASLMGVLPHGAASVPSHPQPAAAAPQPSNPSSNTEGDRKQSRYWTADEHQRFLAAVNTCGPKNYNQISEFVGTRNPKQVRTHAQKYQKRLEREEAKRRSEMRLPTIGAGRSTVGVGVGVAAAAVAAAAAAAMNGTVPGAASGIHHDAMRPSGPTSSSSGKNFSQQDHRESAKTGSSVGGSSSTNDLSASGSRPASGVGKEERVNDTDNTGDNCPTSPAAAAAAAVAAEAVALGGVILQGGEIPTVTVKKELVSVPDTHGNENAMSSDQPDGSDRTNGGQGKNSDEPLEQESDCSEGSVNGKHAHKASTTSRMTSQTGVQRGEPPDHEEQDQRGGEDRLNSEGSPPKVRFKAAVSTGKDEAPVDGAKNAADPSDINTSPPVTIADGHRVLDCSATRPDDRKNANRSPSTNTNCSPSTHTPEARFSTKQEVKAGNHPGSTSHGDGDASEPATSSAKPVSSPVTEMKARSVSLQGRIMPNHDENTISPTGNSSQKKMSLRQDVRTEKPSKATCPRDFGHGNDESKRSQSVDASESRNDADTNSLGTLLDASATFSRSPAPNEPTGSYAEDKSERRDTQTADAARYLGDEPVPSGPECSTSSVEKGLPSKQNGNEEAAFKAQPNSHGLSGIRHDGRCTANGGGVSSQKDTADSGKPVGDANMKDTKCVPDDTVSNPKQGLTTRVSKNGAASDGDLRIHGTALVKVQNGSKLPVEHGEKKQAESREDMKVERSETASCGQAFQVKKLDENRKDMNGNKRSAAILEADGMETSKDDIAVTKRPRTSEKRSGQMSGVGKDGSVTAT